MSDLDLSKLKSTPVPAPRAETRKAALDAAMAAFDAAPNNSADSPKAEAASVRPMKTSNETRSRFMIARHRYALAASVAVFAIGLPAAWQLMQTQTTQQQSTTQLPSKDVSLVTAGKPEPAAPSDALARKEAAERKAAEERSRRVDTAQVDRDAGVTKVKPPTPPAVATAPAPVAPPPSRAAEARPQPMPPVAVLPAPGGRNDMARPRIAEQDLHDQQRSRLGAGVPRDIAVRKEHIVGLVAPESIPQPKLEQGRDKFDATPPNPVKSTAQEPVSTFSIDVDTASYAFVRRALNSGRLPQKDAVRVEEMINYFPYSYPTADVADAPFKPTVTVMPAPWNADNRLVHIAIKGYDLKRSDRPRANLVLLVDISGSMGPADRLPLLQNAFRMLVDNLAPEDTISIVTYASGSDIRLAPTKVAEKDKIIAAIDSLRAGGSTHGAAGIQDAYKVAEASFDKAAVNRVILATDGDWNVGITNRDELKSFIERKRESGVFLSILGVGMGNHNDHLMQTLAQNGNGVAAYIDTLAEARKVLVEEASSSLFPIAKDVKIQIEFNPALVSEYRLIGYETRMLARADFNNDKVDAGDVGSGHSVTAIYEVTPVGAPKIVDDLRYGPAAKTQVSVPAQPSAPADQARRADPAAAPATELGFLKLRYKLPKEETSRLITLPITQGLAVPTIAAAPEDVRFSIAVAAFGQLLKGQPYMKSYNYDDVVTLANGAKGADPYGYRAEMVSLVRLAKSARP